MNNTNINLLASFFFTLFLCTVQSAKILGVFPVPGTSHFILANELMKGLAEKGHDVTVIAPFEENNPPRNGSYITVLLTGLQEEIEKSRQQSKHAEMVLNHTNVQKLLNSGETFDAVIVEQFINKCHKALASHFNAPLIVFSSHGANSWTNPLVGNPSPPSYIPKMLSNYSPQMTFSERLFNTILRLANDAVHHLYLCHVQDNTIKKYIPNGSKLEDVLYNASLILLSSHPSLSQPVPHVPNMIEIGGFHVRPPRKLPQDLQEYLDNSTEGVIYFSMGSNVKSSDLPAETRDAILNTFAKLKQKVLWKWETDDLPGKPTNVKLSKWFPQQDILAHPKVRLFITHGGLLSTIETTYHGVPILAIPVIGDQKLNSKIAAENGIGVVLPYTDLNEETFTNNLNEILQNPEYSYNAKNRARIFHDRPASPLDTATYWIEYVIRHKGATHLRVATLELPWYKYHLLDVFAFLTLLSIALLFVSFALLRKIISKLTSKFHRKTDQKVKTN